MTKKAIPISQQTIKTIKQALLVARATKTEEILLDDFGLSGRSTETQILIIHPMAKKFEFSALGIGRVTELWSRLNLVIDDPNLTGYFEEPELEPDSGKVYKLVFKTKKTKIEFRCTKPDRIKTKKTLNDPIYFRFILPEETVKMMTSGTTAMGCPTVTFFMNDEGHLYLKLLDNEGDGLEHLITKRVDIEPECDVDTFNFTYSLPKLAPLLRTSAETKVSVTRRGALNLDSEGFSIYLVPDL